MRGLFSTLIVLVIIFFGVGEWRGWNVGVMPQTPLFLYKTTSSRSTVRRLTGGSKGLQFNLNGKLNKGTARLEVTFESPQSVQNPHGKAIPKRTVYKKEFVEGEPLMASEFINQGTGFYRFRIYFSDASGRVNLKLPTTYEATSN